jgi:type VI secretion system secreted protein Hcp
MRVMKAGLLVLGLASATAQAANEEFFLKIPGINGESQAQAYPGWIQIDSFTESFVNSTASRGGAGAGGARERTSCQDLHLSKMLDKTSAELAMAVATGHTYSPVLLAAVRTSGDRPVEFLRFTLSNVIISSVAFAGDTGTSARIETLVLRPTRVEVQYTPQNADGSVGATITATVDCASTFL